LLVAERARLVERHVVSNERRRTLLASHRRADAERLRSPQRGKSGRHARAVARVAARAVIDEQPPTTRQITQQIRHLGQPFTANVLAVGYALRDVRKVRDDVLHLATLGWQLRSGKAPNEAVVHAILD